MWHLYNTVLLALTFFMFKLISTDKIISTPHDKCLSRAVRIKYYTHNNICMWYTIWVDISFIALCIRFVFTSSKEWLLISVRRSGAWVLCARAATTLRSRALSSLIRPSISWCLFMIWCNLSWQLTDWGANQSWKSCCFGRNWLQFSFGGLNFIPNGVRYEFQVSKNNFMISSSFLLIRVFSSQYNYYSELQLSWW